MLRRGDSSASESSSRGRSSRPMSFPNMAAQSSNQAMNNKIQEMDKKFKHVSLAKETKRHSLTESEASDISTALSSNSARMTGSYNNRQQLNRHHIQAMQQIRSDLDRYATFHMSTVQQQYVRDLMNEMNVDQDTAVRAIRDTDGKSIEAARETITRLLSKKMQQETQLQQVAQLQHHASNMHPVVSQQEYQQALRHRSMYGPHEVLPQRGSPDGASTRADSPPVNGRIQTKHGQGNNNYEAGNVVKSQKQLQMDQNYNQLPRQYVAESVYEPRKLPTTSPPSYPGTNTNRNSGIFSPPDVGTSGIQAQPGRDQSRVYNVDRMNMAAAESSEDTGVKQGHVQQMIQRMSPSTGGMLTTESGMLNDVNVAPMIPETNPHQPIIKGSSSNSPFYSNNYSASGPPPTTRLPPSYNTAQRYRKMTQQQQQQQQQSNYTASIPGNCFNQSEAVHSGDKRIHQSNQRVGVSTTSAINSALMGNIQQHGFDPPPGNQSSMYSNASDYSRSSKDDPHVGLSPRQYAPSSSVSSNGSSIATSNDKSDYSAMHFNPNNFNQPVPRNQVSGKPKVMTSGQPTEGVMDCTPSYNEAISQSNNQQYIQLGAGHEKPSHYVNQHHNNNTTFSARRDPPPYDDKAESVNAASHRQLHVDISRARKSTTGPRGGKPSPTTKVAEVYLNAVETNAENAQQTVVMRRPKTIESAVKAARVSAGNNKRHSGSYSAAPCSKQSNRQVEQTLPEGSSDSVSLFQDDPTIEKTITTSPVPVRRNLKTKTVKGKSQKKCTDELSSDSNLSDEEDSVHSAGGQEEGESSDLPKLCSHTRRMKKYSPEAFKFYMEQHVENVIKGYKARTSRRWQLEAEMTKFNLPDDAKSEMRKMLFQKESNYIRLKRAKIDLSMFDMIKKIGVGAFGKVMLARNKTSNKLYAIKFLKKRDVLRRNQVAHVKAERDILAEADNDWVVRLYYTFQDKENLYFVMDFVPGGDMMSLLIKKEIFDQSLARFYTAELTLALESVHRMGFIHRDIKPDNILIDRNGHIKLTDFGLCTGFRWTHDSKYYQRDGHARQDSMDFSSEWANMPSKPLDRRRMRDANRHVARSLVGTPNYIAPEVLLREGYTQLCDWWSVGVILFEMVVGHPPFHSDSPSETQMKVINFKNTLRIPSYAHLAPQTVDVIMQLCCDQRSRLGKNGGAAEVKQHSFFAGINWSTLRQMESPYKPEIKFSEDTSNFDPPPSGEHSTLNLGKDGKLGTLNNGTLRLGPGEHAFFEFTFRRFFDEDGRAQSTAPRGYYDNRDPENDDDDERWSREGSKPMFV